MYAFWDNQKRSQDYDLTSVGSRAHIARVYATEDRCHAVDLAGSTWLSERLGTVAPCHADLMEAEPENNYWGSAQGPQPTGPGDAAGGACDQNGGVTSVKPFVTSPTAITPLQ